MKKILQQRQTLITGEYLVLDGAKAFALPTKKVKISSLKMEQRNHLESYDADGSIWFEDPLFATISSGITDVSR
jgi:hypothetical protein